jgi:nucleoside phosphorylase
MSTELVSDAALGEALRAHGAELTDVATTLAVTTNDPLAARLSAFSGCGAEHLEAYGVAASCAAHGVPFVALFGVANSVGSRGRDEWRQNHRAASASAIAVLLAWLGAGARGLAARADRT